jgi:hypothetical protein
MYKCVTTQVDSSLIDLYPGYWSPSHDNFCCFKVSVLAPLEWGHQMLSGFGFSTYFYITEMCFPLIMWSKSNHSAVFSLDLKSAYEGEHTIFWSSEIGWPYSERCSLAPSIYLQMIRFHPSPPTSVVFIALQNSDRSISHTDMENDIYILSQ